MDVEVFCSCWEDFFDEGAKGDEEILGCGLGDGDGVVIPGIQAVCLEGFVLGLVCGCYLILVGYDGVCFDDVFQALWLQCPGGSCVRMSVPWFGKA